MLPGFWETVLIGITVLNFIWLTTDWMLTVSRRFLYIILKAAPKLFRRVKLIHPFGYRFLQLVHDYLKMVVIFIFKQIMAFDIIFKSLPIKIMKCIISSRVLKTAIKINTRFYMIHPPGLAA